MAPCRAAGARHRAADPVRRPAASRSTAKASAPPAGRNCRSSRRLIVRGSAFPSSTIPAPNCCRWRRSPIRRPIARARAAVRYDDVARTLVHALKYQDRTDLAPAMGRWMARAGRELLAEADVLMPVPLHWRRGWSRRYNQSGALARVDRAAERREAGVGGAAAGAADRAADRAVAAAAGDQRAGRLQGRRRAGNRRSRAAA